MQVLVRVAAHRFLLSSRAGAGASLSSVSLLPPCQPLPLPLPLTPPPLHPPHHYRHLSRCSPINIAPSQELRDCDLDTFNYGEAWYWDKRYTRDSRTYDWYQTYADIAPLVKKYFPTSGRVLAVGCGNAAISEDMVNDGYQDIVNIDISPVVIDAMRKKYSHVPQLKYMRMDVQDLSDFGDCSFDSVLDKGCLDALMCGRNAHLSIPKMLVEVSRILKPGGTFLLITYGDPRSRLPDLNRKEHSWTTSLYVIPRPDSKKALEGCTRACSEPVFANCNDGNAAKFVPDDQNCHFVYTCTKMSEEL